MNYHRLKTVAGNTQAPISGVGFTGLLHVDLKQQKHLSYGLKRRITEVALITHEVVAEDESREYTQN